MLEWLVTLTLKLTSIEVIHPLMIVEKLNAIGPAASILVTLTF